MSVSSLVGFVTSAGRITNSLDGITSSLGSSVGRTTSRLHRITSNLHRISNIFVVQPAQSIFMSFVHLGPLGTKSPDGTVVTNSSQPGSDTGTQLSPSATANITGSVTPSPPASLVDAPASNPPGTDLSPSGSNTGIENGTTPLSQPYTDIVFAGTTTPVSQPGSFGMDTTTPNSVWTGVSGQVSS